MCLEPYLLIVRMQSWTCSSLWCFWIITLFHFLYYLYYPSEVYILYPICGGSLTGNILLNFIPCPLIFFSGVTWKAVLLLRKKKKCVLVKVVIKKNPCVSILSSWFEKNIFCYIFPNTKLNQMTFDQ